jgi:hypothetical protein
MQPILSDDEVKVIIRKTFRKFIESGRPSMNISQVTNRWNALYTQVQQEQEFKSLIEKKDGIINQEQKRDLVINRRQQRPSYQPPVTQQLPSFQPPSFQPPSFQPPSYQPQSFQPPVIQQPQSFQPPVIQQPPSYQPQSFQPPVIQQPQRQPPSYQPQIDITQLQREEREKREKREKREVEKQEHFRRLAQKFEIDLSLTPEEQLEQAEELERMLGKSDDMKWLLYYLANKADHYIAEPDLPIPILVKRWKDMDDEDDIPEVTEVIQNDQDSEYIAEWKRHEQQHQQEQQERLKKAYEILLQQEEQDRQQRQLQRQLQRQQQQQQQQQQRQQQQQQQLQPQPPQQQEQQEQQEQQQLQLQQLQQPQKLSMSEEIEEMEKIKKVLNNFISGSNIDIGVKLLNKFELISDKKEMIVYNLNHDVRRLWFKVIRENGNIKKNLNRKKININKIDNEISDLLIFKIQQGGNISYKNKFNKYYNKMTSA